MAGPEARIRTQFTALAAHRGWLAWVQHGTSYSGPRRLDVLVIAMGVPVAIEFKTPMGRLTPRQADTIRELRAKGIYAFVARSLASALRAVEWAIQRKVEPSMTEAREFNIDDFLNEIDTPPVSGKAHLDELLSADNNVVTLPDDYAPAVTAPAVQSRVARDALAAPARRGRKPREATPPDTSNLARLVPTDTAPIEGLSANYEHANSVRDDILALTLRVDEVINVLRGMVDEIHDLKARVV